MNRAIFSIASLAALGLAGAVRADTFGVTETVVNWLAPKAGSYKIYALGAQGGTGHGGAAGGLGAEVVGTFTFAKGASLDIIVGEMGGSVPGFGPSAPGTGGGGGGSFVRLGAFGGPLLLAAGGGGGGDNAPVQDEGSDGFSGTSGTGAFGFGGLGGANGSGGEGGFQVDPGSQLPVGGGGGGAGYNSDGAYGGPPHGGYGGQSASSGFAGGAPDGPGVSGQGGFGGGGGGAIHGGGGGGGYSGGGGGGANLDSNYIYFLSGRGGGGGGSYDAGADQILVSGAQSGEGSVIINFLSASVPEPTTWTMMILGVFGIGAAARRRRGASGRILAA